MNQLSEDLRRSLTLYIQENYIEENCEQDFIFEVADTKGAGDAWLSNGIPKNLEDLVNSAGETFQEALFRIIDEKGLKDSDVYNKALIDRKLFSKIRSNPAYHPKKTNVLALAVALELTIEETIDFLAKAEYALSPGSKGDLIVKYFIEHKIYDIQTINYALYEFELPLLGNE